MELQTLPAASRSSVDASRMLLTVPQPSQPPESSPASRRFRALVEKLINQRRACTVLQEVSRGYSIDQGVDPRNERAERRFGSQKVKCAIEVTHYSVGSCRTVAYDNVGLISWLDKATDSPRRGEVRWINVGGVSWDVIKALAIRYNLHPLSVEDVMLGSRERSFKIDYYQQHLFAQLTSYTHQKERDVKAAAKKLRGNASFNPMGRARDHQSAHNVVPTIKTSNVDGPDSTAVGQIRPRSLKSKSSSISELGMSTLAIVHPAASSHHTSRSLDEEAIHALKLESGMLGIDRTRIFVFLLKDGTLISIHQEPTLYGEELRARLETESIMRSLPEASLLFHGFLDLVTDHLINIVDEYQNTILEFERSILLKPTLLAVQALHLISGDIRLLEMAIKPLQRLVYGLRRYDKDRYKSVAMPGEVVIRGFMCEEAVIYLADIHDHIRFVILSLGGQRSTTKELVEYTFNMTANDSRSVMRVLLIVTVIFLPLMFITQYFGMNFVRMNSVQHHSDALFWKIVGPILFTLIMVALRKRIIRTLFDDTD